MPGTERALPFPRVRWQPNMAAVLTALVPVALTAVYFFGWRAVAVLAVTNGFAFATEWSFTRRRGEPVTLAVFVTGSLLALSLPPGIPFWMCAVGAVVAVAFGKELFGGMGRNLFNPALVGRAFLYVSFPSAMTASWTIPFEGGLGGFLAWFPADGVSRATHLPMLAAGAPMGLAPLFWGGVAGSLGETSKAAVLLGGAYLVLWKRVAPWEIAVSAVLGMAAASWVFRAAGWVAGPDPLRALLAGGFLYGAVFMATEPVTAPRLRGARVVFGLLVGVVTAVIRAFGNFPEGVTFAILLGNTFGPVIEEALKAWKVRRAPEGAGGGAR